MEEFIEYTYEKGSIIRELKRLGWSIEKQNNEFTVKVPLFTDVIKKNKLLADIINTKNFSVTAENIILRL